MGSVYEVLVSVGLLGGMIAFVVWAIRNRPSSRAESNTLDPVTEKANAEARAYASRSFDGPGSGGV